MNTSGAALLALRAFRSSKTPSGNNLTLRTYAKQTKPPKATSGGSSGSSGGSSSDGKNLDPPSNVFRQVDKSAIGPAGTAKDGQYKNPEYFCYHNMSYAEMEIVMAKSRVPQPSNRK